MANSNFTLTKEYLHEIFYYKDGELYWKIKKAIRTKINTIAGGIRKDGYKHIRVTDKRYLTHRLIFLYHYGYLPIEIDHIDGNPSNNHIDNLRESTRNQNCFNTKIKITNKSGIKGVYWNKTANKWKVQIMTNGKRKFLGNFCDLKDAEIAIIDAREKYHLDFANHGI